MKLSGLLSTYDAQAAGQTPRDAAALDVLRQLGLEHGTPPAGQSDTAIRRALVFAEECDALVQLRHAGGPGVTLISALLPLRAVDPALLGAVAAEGAGLSLADAFFDCMARLGTRVSVRLWKPASADPALPEALALVPGLDRSETPLRQIAGIGLNGAEDARFDWAPGAGFFAGMAGCAEAPNCTRATETAARDLWMRHAVALWWFGGWDAPAADPRALAELATIFPAGHDLSRHRWLLDLSAEGGPPVIAAVSTDPSGGGLLLGAAAHATVAEAARAAALALCQSEAHAASAQRKHDKHSPDRLSNRDRLWLARASSAPVPHARPAAGPPRSAWDAPPVTNAAAALGPAWRFEIGAAQRGAVVVRLIAPNLCQMERPDDPRLGEGSAPRLLGSLPPPL